MALINITPIQDGTTAQASQVNTPLQTIVDEFNGNISSVNLANGAVTTNKLGDGAVTQPKLAKEFSFLGYDELESNTTVTGTGVVDIGTEVNFTIPAGGARVKITGNFGSILNHGSSNNFEMIISDASNTLTRLVIRLEANWRGGGQVIHVAELSAGSHTYKLSASNGVSGTTNIDRTDTHQTWILAELI